MNISSHSCRIFVLQNTVYSHTITYKCNTNNIHIRYKSMPKTSSLSIRIDTETKDKAEAVCKELGTNLSNAVNIFLASLVRCNGFPFELRIETPNNETMQAMQEARNISRDPTVKRYKNADSLMKDLLD